MRIILHYICLVARAAVDDVGHRVEAQTLAANCLIN